LFLKPFFGISFIAFALLYYYEWRVGKVRRVFLKKVELDRFLEMVDLSISSVSSMLSFSSVVLSIWAGFGLLASPDIIRVYGEDIFMIIATAALGLVLFAITLYIYHLCHFFSLENLTDEQELELRKDLFIRGETFFVFGTAFFLLTFVYSFVTMSAVLSPNLECLIVVVTFGISAIILLVLLAIRKLWYFVNLFRRM
jgi:hypothetical protein